MARTAKPWFDNQRLRWMAWIGGKKVRLLDGPNDAATRKLAKEALADLLYEARHNPAPESPHQTIASVIEAYLVHGAAKLAASSVEAVTPYLQSFAEHYGRRLVVEVRALHVDQWLAAHPTWKSDWTKNLAVRSVKRAFNWAVKEAGILKSNPFTHCSHPTGLPRRDMTVAEFQGILRVTGNKRRCKKMSPGARFRQVLVFLWHTGARPGEAGRLQWSHIDLDKRRVLLPAHKTRRRQRKPAPRTIVLDDVVIKLLRFLAARREGEFVFLNHRRRPWSKNGLVQRMIRARAAAGVSDEAKLYGARHAFGSRGVLNGCDLKTLSSLMGHTTTRMTEHYVHLSGQDQHLADAMRLVNGRPAVLKTDGRTPPVSGTAASSSAAKPRARA